MSQEAHREQNQLPLGFTDTPDSGPPATPPLEFPDTMTVRGIPFTHGHSHHKEYYSYFDQSGREWYIFRHTHPEAHTAD